MESEAIPLSSKPRFEILDGLRGVAAMIVVAFHLFETYSSGPSDQILNHGYLLGMISYPLYITHYPMIYVQMNWAAQHADAPLGTHIWVAVSIFIASIAVAYASVKVYDIPVREWLSDRFIRSRKKA